MMLEPLSAPMRDRLSSGVLVDLRPTPVVEAPAAQVDDWGPDRDIEASLLAELLTLPTTHDAWTFRPLWLRGARIVGQLDLGTATLTRPLRLEDCRIEQYVVLRDTVASTIDLSGCLTPGLDAHNLQTRGDLALDRGFMSTAQVILAGAHIGGQLNCGGSTFTGKDRPAILADGLTVDGGMSCNKGFTANGAVRLLGAHIGGQLNCRGGTFNNPGGQALAADNLTVEGSIVCTNGFMANGAVHLLGAKVGGLLSCGGGTFNNPGGAALAADNVTVDGTMFCNNGFDAYGAVRLHSAEIGSHLICSGGTFVNRDGDALDASHLTVKGDVFCNEQFTAEGAVILSDAHITGQLDCAAATFHTIGDTAIEAGRLHVDGDVSLRDGFTASGAVSLTGARIGGYLDCTDGSFDASSAVALDLERADVTEAIYFRPRQLDGQVNLTLASTGAWYDSRATWPGPNLIRLPGFTYDTIAAEPRVSVRQRLRWLRRDGNGFTPQTYEQYAAVLRREGDGHGARTVLISAQWRRRLAVNSWYDRLLWPIRFVWSLLLRVTLGYGYRPWRILVPIVLLFTFGWWWFDRAEQDGDIVRAQGVGPDVEFDPGRYTADVLIPGVDLGERDNFVPMGDIAWWSAGYTISGWALAALLIAGLTGVFKRQ